MNWHVLSPSEGLNSISRALAYYFAELEGLYFSAFIIVILSNTGIYVLMFENIIVTFSHTIFLSVLLLVAFWVAFYMAFFSPEMQFTPFSNPGISIFSGMTYATGHVEFNDLFSLSHDGDKHRDLPFLPVSIMLWITFLIIMIILLINMLVRDLLMSHEYYYYNTRELPLPCTVINFHDHVYWNEIDVPGLMIICHHNCRLGWLLMTFKE